MNKKTLIACIVLLILLVAGIATSVGLLYSGSGSGRTNTPDGHLSAQQRYPLLGAVPSDAAMLLYFNSMDDGVRLFSDTTKVFGTLVEGAAKRGFRPHEQPFPVFRLAGLAV